MHRAYVDTETTGFDPGGGATIIEVAGVVVDDKWKELRSYEAIVNVGEEALAYKYAAQAMEISGITKEEVLAGKHPATAAMELEKFLEGVDTVHAFNNQFDQRFLGGDPWFLALERWGDCVMLAAMNPMGDAGALPERYGKYKWPKLSEAVEFYKVKVKGPAHRALTDVRRTVQVHKKILTA